MRITTKTDYAVILLITLARHPKQPVSLEFVSQKTGVSEAYLQRIAARLKKKGLIKPKLGAFGGYHLNKPAHKITVGMVVEAVGDTVHSVKCTDPKSHDCPHKGQCVHQSQWQEFQSKVSKIFDQHTIADMTVDKKEP